MYGKAYLCKAAVIFGYDFSVVHERYLLSAHRVQITITHHPSAMSWRYLHIENISKLI
ncbi:hypothetical protein HMPREF3212_01175 [Citrobacter freundii]|nr:hypothetical protein HMPREF3212_01175 [Citrobacter freundii]